MREVGISVLFINNLIFILNIYITLYDCFVINNYLLLQLRGLRAVEISVALCMCVCI